VVTLNSYSRQVLRAFLDLLPELGPYAHCAEGGVLDITVPHPKIESGLNVTAAGGEVSIGFREWHTHADLLAAGSEKDMIAVAVEFVRDILHGRAWLAVSYRDGSFQDAWVTSEGEEELTWVQPDKQLEFGTWQQLAS
jgi:hypothetical protein